MKLSVAILFSILCYIIAEEKVCKDVDFVSCLARRSKTECLDNYQEMNKVCPHVCNFCDTDVPDTGDDGPDGVPCGVPVSQGSRVVGGEIAKKDAWPWQVSIYYRGKFLCGGSILSKRWVVTAAHCVFGMTASRYHIVVGDHDRRSVDGDEQIFTAKKAFAHAGWVSYFLENDIAMIKLNAPIEFNNHVRPICLPKKDEDVPVGSQCFVTGWGADLVGKDKPPTELLKQSKLTVRSKEACKELNTKKLHIPINDEMLCAGSGGVKEDTACHGDSGGPFVCRDDTGVWKLQGVVSWGSAECYSNEGYSVFARVTKYLDWIEQSMQ